ncbi:MAG: extensin family protein [Myxococcales bacterium]|nr:extensin family protein [Myxococcales bacterium]
MPPQIARHRAAQPLAAALGLCALILLSPSRAAAENPPEVEALRAELQRIEAGPGASLPSGARLSIAYNIDVAERIAGKFQPQSEAWRRRAAGFLKLAAEGRDPIVEQRGKILMRGYRSAISELLQGYAIYIPPDYDPAKRYPLMVMLHGGSANGNLFLGVVLGNNMNWKEYPIHLWDDYSPRWSPDWIVVAPDGFGQVMWRWMGEQDVLDVIDDVQKHYSVDPDRIALGGLSNGGVGAYNIGMRHAHRFSLVEAIAGAPSWLQYSGGRFPQAQELQMRALSGMQLAENALNTDFRYYHGHHDTGPMKPHFVHELTEHIGKLGVPFKETWFDAGHDLLYLVHRHGRNYAKLSEVRRKKRPSEVRLLTGDYRAARQHWVTVTRIERYPELARVRAVARDGEIEVETDNVAAFSLDLRDAPVGDGDATKLQVNDQIIYQGKRASLGHVIHLRRGARGFETGFPLEDPDALYKKPGSAGPIADAYYGAIAHVYGTGDADSRERLKQSAERGAHGWPLWLWRLQQKVVADTEVDAALMASHHLVLYGTPGSNGVLERIAGRLPVAIDRAGVKLGSRRFDGPEVGVKFIHPNPLAPERYVIVQAGVTPKAVDAGHRLPDFLPDYIVYDRGSTATRPRLISQQRGPKAPLAMGYFDHHWRLPEETAGHGGGPDGAAPAPMPRASDAGRPGTQTSPTRTPPLAPSGGGKFGVDAGAHVPPAPPAPPRATRFAAPRKSPAGKVARVIARRVSGFENFRAKMPFGRWQLKPRSRWQIREDKQCLQALREAGIRARPWDYELPTPVPTPVELRGRVDGVWFRMTHGERTMLMSCEMASRLPDLVAILKRHKVRGVDVMSAYRTAPRASFHTLGMGLDLLRFFTLDDVLSVLYDFETTPERETCSGARPRTRRGRKLLDIACRMAGSGRFSTVLTPNYNEGHRDHFHIDIRPQDPRLYLR